MTLAAPGGRRTHFESILGREVTLSELDAELTSQKNVNFAIGRFQKQKLKLNFLTLRPGSGTRNGVQIRTPRKIWGRQVQTWGPGSYIPRDKRSMVDFKFFVKTSIGEIYIFLTCQL